MSSLLKAAHELSGLAEKAGLPMDKFVRTLAVLDEHEMAQQSERRANPEEKEAITKILAGLDGELTPDIAVSDILARAGVRKAQGTTSFAKREVKRLCDGAPQT
jgi:hypothetical protein